MLARCARYPAATARTLRLFPYFYFSQYSTRARAIRQRIARRAFSHISIFLNTAPAPAPFGNGSRVAPFPIFLFFSIRHPLPLTLRQRIARCAICPSSRAHPLKGSSTQIQMPIDSNSKAHRLKFKCSSTQMPKNETPPGEEMRKSSGKNARHSIRVGNTSSNNIVPRSVPSG